MPFSSKKHSAKENDDQVFSANAAKSQRTPPSGQFVPRQALPDSLRSGIEQLAGVSMSDVKVHLGSSKPAQLQAHAFAQGNEIHVAPGQEKHLPHEAWHVAQQKQGRVNATTQLNGVGINDSEQLEREADQMGKKALSTQMKPSKQAASSPTAAKPVAQLYGKKDWKERAPALSNLQQLGGTASDVYSADLAQPMGSEGATVGYVKKSLRAVNKKDVTKEQWKAIQEAQSAQRENRQAHKDNYTTAIGAAQGLHNAHSPTIGGATTKNVGVESLSLMDMIGNAEMDPGAIQQMGINFAQSPELLLEDPRLIARQVISSRLDKTLGTNALSNEMFGKLNGETVGVSAKVQGGQALMSKQNNQSVFKNVDWSNPLTQKGMSDLTLLDAITGQQDRHSGNIMVTPTGQVKGIDNDMAFGKDKTKYLKAMPSAIFTENKDQDGNTTSFNYLQELIDEQTGNAVLGMSDKDFVDLLKGSSKDPERLNKAEIDQALMRFKAVKAKVQTLKDQNQLVTNWDNNTYQQMLNEGKGGNNYGLNYLSRSEYDYRTAAAWGTPNAHSVKEQPPQPVVPQRARGMGFLGGQVPQIAPPQQQVAPPLPQLPPQQQQVVPPLPQLPPQQQQVAPPLPQLPPQQQIGAPPLPQLPPQQQQVAPPLPQLPPQQMGVPPQQLANNPVFVQQRLQQAIANNPRMQQTVANLERRRQAKGIQ